MSLVIVSSGAIALGRRLLNLDAKALPLDQSQAAASAGQIALSQAWAAALAEHGIVTGQILLTPNITEERRYFLNARTTISTLLGLGAVPIINENDSVATAEIRYGDNDRLSARVATMIEADCLILLSDVDGLYSAPPARDPNAQHLPFVAAITPEIDAMAGGAASHLSRGGMTTKIEAGKIATQAGTAMIIAKGTEDHPLRALTEGARHTLFAPAESRAQARKRWIMGHARTRSAPSTSMPAPPAPCCPARASCRSASPASPAISIAAMPWRSSIPMAAKSPAASPVSAATQADLVKGKNSARVADLLGIGTRSELIHRDNMVVLMGLEAKSLMSAAEAVANDLTAMMLEIGRRARAAAGVLAFATPESKVKALGAAADAIDNRRDDILSANALDMRAAEGKGISQGLPRSPAAQRQAHRRHDRGPPHHRRTARSGRPRAGRMDPPQRHDHPSRLDPARRHRRHLREPPQRHRRCRRADAESRQCGDPSRRFGQRELVPRHPCLPRRRPAGRRPAR